MGVGRLNIWISDVADACGTWQGSGRATVFDCKGILEWHCGRFRTEGTNWQPVPGGVFRNLPFRCGHLEVELPPGCYWVVAGSVSPPGPYIHLNYTTHVGITHVGCDEAACVKLYNPSIRLCWNWFLIGLKVLAARGGDQQINAGAVNELQERVENELLRNAPRGRAERVIEEVFAELAQRAARGDEPEAELGKD